MKTALLHYWLTNMRGGEKVLAALADLLPEADVFTHAFGTAMRDNAGAARTWRGHAVRESLVAHLPFGRRWPQAYLPLMPTASRALPLDGYDLIVSSESGPIKGIRKPAAARHVCYCHTPMRYVWDLYDDYYAASGLCGKVAMRLFTPYLRKEDLKSAESVDQFVANSRFVAERICRIYGRDAVVVHPPVDVAFYGSEADAQADVLSALGLESRGYYLCAGELRAYKRPDLAVEACLRMNRRLAVVGNGKMRDALERKTAGRGRIAFLGRRTDAELRALYGGAKALIFPGVEDFGIVPVEAQAAGTPVIALGRGGARETVVDGVTGLFFERPSVEALCEAMETFESRTFDASACRRQAARFSEVRFASEMKSVLAQSAIRGKSF